jgi:hypothetical protein
LNDAHKLWEKELTMLQKIKLILPKPEYKPIKKDPKKNSSMTTIEVDGEFTNKTTFLDFKEMKDELGEIEKS